MTSELSTSALIEQCWEELQHYRHAQSNDAVPPLELFRRALVARDELAWEGVYKIYSGHVQGWLQRATSGQALMQSQEEMASLINATFARFSHGVTPSKFADFPTMKQLLSYLKLCARSVAIDELRSECSRMARELPIEELEDQLVENDPSDSVGAQLDAREFWRIIRGLIHGTSEQLVLHHMCLEGMPSRELLKLYPTVFPTVEDVYRTKNTILKRLKQNKHLLDLLSQRYFISKRRTA